VVSDRRRRWPEDGGAQRWKKEGERRWLTAVVVGERTELEKVDGGARVCGEEAGRRYVRAADTTGPRWPRRRRRRPDVRAVFGDAHGHREDDGGGVRSRGSPENYLRRASARMRRWSPR
jgi:hypothetical protein